MPPPATGQRITTKSGLHIARIPIGAKRPTFRLNVRTCADADERTATLAEISMRLRGISTDAEIARLCKMAGEAASKDDLQTVLDAVDAIACGSTETTSSAIAPTFAEFADEWTSGRLRERFRDHVREKDSTRDKELLRLYINPEIGRKRITDVTLEDADACMRRIPPERSTATRRHVAQVVCRVFALAVYPGRVRTDNPIPKGWLPKVKDSKAKECLFPDEDRALLGCRDVALVRRLAYGVLCREGMRTDELASLAWRDVDLRRGILTLDRNKTDDPRAWNMDHAVVRALERWRQMTNPSSTEDRVFTENGVPLDVHRLASLLRRDLKRAGVDRPQLFEKSDARRPIRAHDLRATFVTSSLANGATETWVADRTGHRSSAMINRYRRRARAYSGQLAPLDLALPGFFVGPESFGQRSGIDERCGSDSNRRVTDLQGESEAPAFTIDAENPTDRAHEVYRDRTTAKASARSLPDPATSVDEKCPNDGVSEAELEDAIVRATLDGRGALAEEIASVLRRRRHVPSNVLSFGRARNRTRS